MLFKIFTYRLCWFGGLIEARHKCLAGNIGVNLHLLENGSDSRRCCQAPLLVSRVLVCAAGSAILQRRLERIAGHDGVHLHLFNCGSHRRRCRLAPILKCVEPCTAAYFRLALGGARRTRIGFD